MKRTSKIISALLALVMLCSMAVPAMAASTNTIEVYFNDEFSRRYSYGSQTPVSNLELFTVGETDIASVTISSGSYSDTKPIADGMNGVLPNGTTYTFHKTTNSSGITTVTLSTSAIRDDISINVTTSPTDYTIVANSGLYNAGQDYGSEGNPTCTVDNALQTITGGEQYSVTFTPMAGQDIKYLNIRPNYTNATNLISADANTATVAGKVLQISRGKDGSVTVSCASATCDMFITALTGAQAKKYTLNVSTGANVTADTTYMEVPAGSTKTITFTPSANYFVSSITIKDGNSTATISGNKNSVSVNGHTYSVSRQVNGNVTLSVPAINADVEITATADTGLYYVIVNSASGISSNFDSMTYVSDRDDVTIRLTPDSDYELLGFKISTGKETVYVDSGDTSFVLNGIIYRVYESVSGALTIYLNPMPGNVEITPSVKSDYHTITVKYDKGIDINGSSSFSVSDGDSKDVTFIPVDGHTIEEIKIVRGGRTYRADVDDDYIVVNGTDYPIRVTKTGRVTVSLVDVTANMTITASSDYVSASKYSVTKSTDSRSKISVSTDGEHVTVLIAPNKGYALTSVVVKAGNNEDTITRPTTSIKLGRISYPVTYKSNGSISIYFDKLPSNIKVTSKAASESSVDAKTYHAAYMEGIGYNSFAPDVSMTRAEAVTLLVRLFGEMTDSEIDDYKGDSSFRDVPTNAWYSGYLAWAEEAGYLDNIMGGRYFRPTDAITRAEFVDLMCRFNDANTGYTNTYPLYSDMTTGHWAAKQINYATAHGWINGYPNGNFGPENNIGRAEIVTITNRATGRVADKNIGYYYPLVTFADVPMTHWAYYQILEATNTHFVERVTSAGETWVYFE